MVTGSDCGSKIDSAFEYVPLGSLRWAMTMNITELQKKAQK
jgi:hypothetical protein